MARQISNLLGHGVLACLLLAGCAPGPSPSSPAATALTTPRASGTASPAPGTEPPSLPAATIDGRWPVVASALAVGDGSSVWYLRTDGRIGVVGHLDPTTGATIEMPAGPAPVVLAVTEDGLFLLEGMSDVSPATGPRANVIERLDPVTLEVVATGRVRMAPTSLAVAGDTVLVGGVDGSLQALEAGELRAAWSATMAGSGAVSVAADASEGLAWALDGVVEEDAYLLRRVSLADGATTDVGRVPGTGTEGLLARGNNLWVAAVDLEGTRTVLYPVADDGTLGEASSLPRIAAVVADGDAVWWITSTGQVGRLDHGARALPATVGESGNGIAIAADGSAWVATGTEIVRLLP